MNIQLIQGIFDSHDTIELITQMIQVKIKYHENKIAKHSGEEDIKARESKIKQMQKELFELKASIQSANKYFEIDGIIQIK